MNSFVEATSSPGTIARNYYPRNLRLDFCWSVAVVNAIACTLYNRMCMTSKFLTVYSLISVSRTADLFSC